MMRCKIIAVAIYGWVAPILSVASRTTNAILEPPLTPLGVSPAELAQALGHYRRRLHALISALGSTAPLTLHNNAFAALEDLGAMIDVDVGARETQSGGARMSEIERHILLPLLGQLRQRPAVLRPTIPSRGWLPMLHEADQDVAQAERALPHR